MERIQEFSRGGKDFIFFDLSNFKRNEEFSQLIDEAKPRVAKYPPKSLYTITDIEGIDYDTTTKKLIAEWMTYNKPYVKYGVVIGIDEIKRVMVSAIFSLSGRKNMSQASSKEDAIERLLSQE
ncbi:MAG: hypothetical protein FWD19_05920 [Defluviitaleaceae bacterium]|nr:hypothetical protein [Defluviitaleaceae bacterium]